MKESRTDVTTAQRELTETQVISTLLACAQHSRYNLAVWKLPNDPYTHALVSFQHEETDLNNSFEELPSGFLFFPFDNKKQGVYLRADVWFRFANGKLMEGDSPVEARSVVWLREMLDKGVFKSKIQPTRSIVDFPTVVTQETFQDLIRTCIKNIEAGRFEKVVPSRFKRVRLPENFDPVVAFKKLYTAYPNALISFLYTHQYGSWLGATPEVLVNIEQGNVFRTVALAGTQPYRQGVNLRNVAWTQKEIEEQALVSRYIINCFKKIRLREFEEHGPKTIVAGNLMHLKSDFSVDMKATNFPQLGSVMLRLLHPTSAVCGMPMENASEFLLAHEGYDRSFYTGFLGPINFQENSHLFVNLRCMRLLPDEAICFAGAGVTIDSIPEQEWEETEIKMNTLLEVIL